MSRAALSVSACSASADSKRSMRLKRDSTSRDKPLPHVINFDEANSRAAILSCEDGGECARGQRGEYSGLEGILRRKSVRGELSGSYGIILPVVIRDQQGAITIAQFQDWIGQQVT